MVYKVCARCSKMFETTKASYCKICLEINEKEFALIINYINQYPNATVLEIVTETGVTLKSIHCLVEDGRMSYVKKNRM